MYFFYLLSLFIFLYSYIFEMFSNTLITILITVFSHLKTTLYFFLFINNYFNTVSIPNMSQINNDISLYGVRQIVY
jgi:hypothetical protein